MVLAHGLASTFQSSFRLAPTCLRHLPSYKYRPLWHRYQCTNVRVYFDFLASAGPAPAPLHGLRHKIGLSLDLAFYCTAVLRSYVSRGPTTHAPSSRPRRGAINVSHTLPSSIPASERSFKSEVSMSTKVYIFKRKRKLV